MGQSTGLVFSHFPDKESVWRAAMGTPPPTDSPLTRAAPEMLSVLQALVAQRAETNSETDDLWNKAEHAIQAALGLNPADSARNRVVSAPTLDSVGAEIIALAREREVLPSFQGVMEPVFGLCQLLVAQAEGQASGEDVHAAAVTAGATIAQVAVYGARDVPRRSPVKTPAARPADRSAHTGLVRQAR